MSPALSSASELLTKIKTQVANERKRRREAPHVLVQRLEAAIKLVETGETPLPKQTPVLQPLLLLLSSLSFPSYPLPSSLPSPPCLPSPLPPSPPFRSLPSYPLPSFLPSPPSGPPTS